VKTLVAALSAALLGIGVAAPAHAQSASGTVTASATLALPPVTGAGIQNLDFGSLTVGASADVPPGPAGGGTSSAGWRFSGVHKNRPIGLTFALPTELTSGASTLPVDWDNAGYGTACVANGGGCLVSSSFNPAANGGSHTLSIPNNTPGNNFDVTVYAGARTTVPSVPPGVYSAPVTLTMAYLF
jgi:hypothetical protein